MRPACSLLVAVALLVPPLDESARAGSSAHWIGPTGGLWSGPANWTPFGVPNGVPISVAPRGGGVVVLDAFGLSYPSIHVGAGTTIEHPSAMFIATSSLQVHGTWLFTNATPFVSAIQVADDMTLAGTGAIDLGANSQNLIYGIGEVRELTNGPSHTIRGGGQVGGSLRLVNEGLIESTTPTSPLRVQPGGDGHRNDGAIAARSGTTLRIAESTFDNARGAIFAEAGAVLELSGASISGGQLGAHAAGQIRAGAGTSTIADLEIDGEVLVPSGSTLALAGTIGNDGLLRTAGAPGFALVVPLGEAALAGSGALQLDGSSLSRLVGDGTSTLVQAAGHTIRGGGRIGQGRDLALVNHGTVAATDGHLLEIELTREPTINLGVIEARDSAQLRLAGGFFDNDGGEIRARDAAQVQLAATTIAGGALTAQASGQFRVPGVAGGGSSTLADLRNEAAIVVEPAGILELAGAIDNAGTIVTQPLGQFVAVRCGEDVVLEGSGTLELPSTAAWTGIGGVGSTRLLTNAAGHRIRGGGGFGYDQLLDLHNEGEILIDLAEATFDLVDSFVNDGLLRVAGAGRIRLEPSGFLNRGTVQIDAGREFVAVDDFVQEAGSTRVDGLLDPQGDATVELLGGRLGGGGSVAGPLANHGGTIDPSIEPGGAARTLSVGGSVAMHAGARLSIRLEPGANDRLAVGGAVLLGGALSVDLAPGFVPAVGSEFTVLTAASIEGGFDCVTLPVTASMRIVVVQETTSVKLVVVDEPVSPADLDGDGTVGGSDLGLLLSAWGSAVCGIDPCCAADLNRDGVVDGADLGLLLGAWK